MNERSSIMGRMFLLLGLLMLLPAAILVQILRVNFYEGEAFRELWSSQAIDYISIPAQRGNIYDANGSLLVTDTAIYKVAVDPLLIRNTEAVNRVAAVLSNHTGRTARYYVDRINSSPSGSQYLVLERSVPVQAYEELTELSLRGLILEEEYRRNYNFGTLAAHVVGFVNHNMDGMAGLESRYNNILRGRDGQQQVRKDRLNQIFAYVGAPRKFPKQGYSLHTTIDSKIQAIVEEELKEGAIRHLAKYGTAIVMNPKTGEIKAMANYPVYNPNAPATIENENRRNYAVADIIEPGSTFKLVTAIAAVEQNVVSFNERFETPESGRKIIHGQVMRDHNPLGTLTFTEVMAKSSNIATSEIAQRIPPNTFYQYARNMGFGTPSQIDLPGELAGRLQRPYEWSRVTLPWMSIGYEVQVSPVQLVQAYAAFANGGYLMKPFVVKSVTDELGNIIEKNEPKKVRRIARPSTIEKLIPVFEQAVSDSGTAQWASVEGLRIAGKTGTAQKYIDGRYQARYRASFVGFFPVEDPEYVILVLLDEPRTSIYGGFTAGSVFKEIAQRVSGLQNSILRTQPSELLAESSEFVLPKLEGMNRRDAELLLQRSRIPYKVSGNGNYVTGQQPAFGELVLRNTPIEIQLSDTATDSIPNGFARIPDLRDMNMREAVYLVEKAGLEIEMVGSGTIYTQFPRAGDLMRQGRTVTVRGRAGAFNQQRSIVSN